jgi:DNA-binding GntR family transcriptional regulator
VASSGREPAEPLIRVSTRDQVRERLLAAILDGEYEPGSRVVETEVARRLGTSASPVREVLRELEALGLVTSKPFSGVRVRQITAADVLETYPVRVALESLALRSATPVITDAQVDELSALTDRMAEAVEQGDARAQSQWNAQFHRALVAAAGNSALLRSWSVLEPFTRTFLAADFPGLDLAADTEEHRPIIAAVRARDAEAAVAALERHFANVTEMVRLARDAEARAAVSGSGAVA